MSRSFVVELEDSDEGVRYARIFGADGEDDLGVKAMFAIMPGPQAVEILERILAFARTGCFSEVVTFPPALPDSCEATALPAARKKRGATAAHLRVVQ